jgi:hypothetical protein
MMMRRRRPLMRAAMVGGGAYYAGKRAREREDENAYRDQRLDELESQQMAAPQPAASGGSDDMVEKLQKLGALRDQGLLTDAEFEAQKAKVLQGL